MELGTFEAVLGAPTGLGGPTGTTFTEGVQASMLPWAPPGSDFDLMNQALAGMFETVYEIVADQGSPDVPDTYQPGWGILLDPTALALSLPVFLPWLALFVGAVVPIGAPPGAALATILAEQGFQRGTNPGIIAAAVVGLSGTQSCVIEERTAADGSADAYHFLLIVRPEELIDETSLIAAVNAVKPGGVQWTLIQSDAPLLNQYTREFSAITVDLRAATLSDVT